MTTMGDNTEVLVAIAKLEGMLGLALRQAEDHETRIRVIEAQPTPDPDTADRLAKLESRSTVSPRQLWAGLISVLGVVVAVTTILEKIPLFGG